MKKRAETAGQFVRRLRMETGVSLNATARRLRITPSFLSDIELDRRAPSEDVCYRLAVEIEADPEELYLRFGRTPEWIATTLRLYPRESMRALAKFAPRF